MSIKLGLIFTTFLILYGDSYVFAKVVPDSVWDSEITRERRETAAEDCGNKNDELNSTCKVGSCPLDDETVETCCKCLQICCSSEQDGIFAEQESSSSTTNNATKSSGNKDTVSKVEGFLTIVGKDIKTGVSKGWDKVKSTAKSVHESGKEAFIVIFSIYDFIFKKFSSQRN
jgi:hypothetical protein